MEWPFLASVVASSTVIPANYPYAASPKIELVWSVLFLGGIPGTLVHLTRY